MYDEIGFYCYAILKRAFVQLQFIANRVYLENRFLKQKILQSYKNIFPQKIQYLKYQMLGTRCQ